LFPGGDTRLPATIVHRPPALALAVLLVWSSLPSRSEAQAPSEETTQFFKKNCVSCHTIGGGRLAGPDLKGVLDRQKREWLLNYLMDPKVVIDSGDPYAQKLFKEARGVYMPTIPGLDKVRAGKLLDLIKIESGLEKSQFAGTKVSDRPLTAADVARGRALFLGSTSLKGGTPPCISCHTVEGLGGFGGGHLGPDLTSVYARLEGRKALGAWLASPPSATMQPIFGKQPLDGEEVLGLVAFFKDVAQEGKDEAEPASLQFLLAGFAGAALILVIFDFLWRNRFRAVRRPLVEKDSKR